MKRVDNLVKVVSNVLFMKMTVSRTFTIIKANLKSHAPIHSRLAGHFNVKG